MPAGLWLVVAVAAVLCHCMHERSWQQVCVDCLTPVGSQVVEIQHLC